MLSRLNKRNHTVFIKNREIWSFSIDDGDGGENVTFKVTSRFLKLCCAYSNSLKMSNVSEFPWSWFLADHTQVLEEKEKFVVACLRPSQNVKLGIITPYSCSDGKEMYKLKKRDARAKLLFCRSNLLFFWRSRNCSTLVWYISLPLLLHNYNVKLSS